MAYITLATPSTGNTVVMKDTVHVVYMHSYFCQLDRVYRIE